MRLLTLPLTAVRIPAALAMRIARSSADTAAGAARFAYEKATGAGGEEMEERPPRQPATPRTRRARPSRSGNGRPRETEVAGPAAEAAATTVEPTVAPPVEPQPPAPPEPAHVSEEPELVAELAEEGARDGAGAEVSVEEPWPGYDGMTAADVTDRLVAEGPEVAAAVSLYEASGKGRRSILEAASRTMSG
jgi:hypothetical protein